jgi:probable rRNA maturation factor
MAVAVDIQLALNKDSTIKLPEKDQIQHWADMAVNTARQSDEEDSQITVRIVEETEISQLNSVYRDKKGPTNVLSFPFVAPPGMPSEESAGSLGDLVICASIVEKEAVQQHKQAMQHWAHMIVHGTLHLLGFDHQTEQEAENMEGLESAILAKMGYPDPYD